MSFCKHCHCTISEAEYPVLSQVYYDEDYPDIEIGPFCIDCVDYMYICSHCHEPVHADRIKYKREGFNYCGKCYNSMEICYECGLPSPLTGGIYTVNGNSVCSDCYSLYRECEHCHEHKHLARFRIKRDLRLNFPQVVCSDNKCEDCFIRETTTHKRYKIKSCKNCGQRYSYRSDDPKTDKNYCKRCEKSLPKCDLCGNKSHDYAKIHNLDIDKVIHVCHSCLKKHSNRVCSCGRYSEKLKSQRGIFSTLFLCSHCYPKKSECPHCLTFTDGDGVCSNCKDFYVANICERCGSTADHRGQCRVCDGSIIYNYTHKPRVFYHYTERDKKEKYPIFFGIENEVSFKGRLSMEVALKRLYKTYGPDVLVAKSDASIQGDGYEIVTQPMTLAYFHKMDIISMLPDTIYRSKSCGMHVHVGRKAFSSDLHLHRVVEFIHKNETYVSWVAGRSRNHYNEDIPGKSSAYVLHCKKKMNYFGRNLKVNLNNEDTVEFRLFAGSISEFQMRYKVEWLHALITWMREAPVKTRGVVDLNLFISRNRDEYYNINKFLTKEVV